RNLSTRSLIPSSAGSSTLTEIAANLSLGRVVCILTRCGNSRLQDSQVSAQKSTTTTLPFCCLMRSLRASSLATLTSIRGTSAWPSAQAVTAPNRPAPNNPTPAYLVCMTFLLLNKGRNYGQVHESGGLIPLLAGTSSS